jgi:Right handed beta helix region
MTLRSRLVPALLWVPLTFGSAELHGQQKGHGAPFTVVESGQGFSSLQDAVGAIGDGQGTIRVAPGRYRQCAVQDAGRIAYVAEAPGTAVFEDEMCEGKAALVLRGSSARVAGLTFTRMSVPDGNGAGIRIEQGDLEVSESLFVDGQCGILSSNGVNATIKIDHSTFSGLGKHPDGNGAHSLYIGDYGRLSVTNSRFERGTGGHYLKSRAAYIEVLDNSFDDSDGHDTNYMIDLSNGARGRIQGNAFVQGNGKENYSTLIAVASEGRSHSSAGLAIEGNEVGLAPGFQWETAFIRNWTNDALVVRGNELARGITLLARAG